MAYTQGQDHRQLHKVQPFSELSPGAQHTALDTLSSAGGVIEDDGADSLRGAMQGVHSTVKGVDSMEFLGCQTSLLRPSTQAAIITLDSGLCHAGQHTTPVGCFLDRHTHTHLCNQCMCTDPRNRSRLVHEIDASERTTLYAHIDHMRKHGFRVPHLTCVGDVLFMQS